jgi:hypothetical protein
LSWEGDEPSAAVAEEGSTPAAEESAPIPQAETVAPAVEASLPEANMVEGEYTAQTQSSSRSSYSPRETNLVCLLLTGAEAEGSTIPEDVVTTRLPEAGPAYTWQLSRTTRISPTDQHMSFLRTLSSLMRTREGLPGRSPIAPSQARLTLEFF